MTISLQELVDEITPERTVLIFGAGASIPSQAPSVAELVRDIGKEFKIDPTGLSLREISGLAQQKRNRQDLIRLIRTKFKDLKPKGAILNLPLYAWKSIYSTNYDHIVEDSYARRDRPLKVFSSNFDFTVDGEPNATKLFKIHGTIDKDLVDGSQSRMILNDGDYDVTEDYREALYDRLKSDLSPGTLVVIIGQSLADEDLREVVQRAITINQKVLSGGRITMLLYQPDENRALLLENRGIRVAFGGLDDFFSALSKKPSTSVNELTDAGSPLEVVTSLRPITWDVNDEVNPKQANISALFSGWPANYADIVRGFTFERTVAIEIAQFLSESEHQTAVLLGASGVGKTTAARQAILRLRGLGFLAWEHKGDHALSSKAWLQVAQRLKNKSQQGVLLIDEGHLLLYEINDLTDILIAADCHALKLLIVSTRNHWGPRVKTPNIYIKGKEFSLSQLQPQEIDRLLTFVESVPEMQALVEQGFGGFSRYEKRRRLIDRCEADMFVCMKNIFASEKFDDIILREYGTLAPENQDVYRWVAAMEHAGIRVHRQLVMRILGINANAISAVLLNLTDIITEYDVNTREGVYGWRVRHNVIASIVAKYKFYEIEKLIDLFSKVIDNISPTFEIEILTIRQLCNIESGIATIPDKSTQNTLLRRMMSVAPGERVPRHRLMRNLIELGEFEKAESEIRIFEKDFGKEAPVTRYRISLMIARATNTPGLMHEDRVVILNNARELAVAAVGRYESNKYVLATYCDLGVETFRLTGSHEVFDDAMATMKKAESRLGDPDITKMMVRYRRRISGQTLPADGGN
jgi:hypothetical protein